MRRGERRCVIEAVADHEHFAPFLGTRLEPGDLAGRLQLRVPCIDASGPRGALNDPGAVARKKRHVVALAFQLRHGVSRIGANRILETESAGRGEQMKSW